MHTIAQQTIFLSCNSWYLGANIPGKPRLFMPMAGGFPMYAERCAAVARDGYAGFVAALTAARCPCPRVGRRFTRHPYHRSLIHHLRG